MPASAIKLTDAKIVKAVCPEGKTQHYLRDAKRPGLALRVRPSGSKAFYLEFKRKGVKGTVHDHMPGVFSDCPAPVIRNTDGGDKVEQTKDAARTPSGQFRRKVTSATPT